MADKRKYTRKQKLSAVLAAEVGGLTVTAEALSIPKSTLKTWLDHPMYAQFRASTREDLQAEVMVAAHLAWKRVIETAPFMEPRDAIFAAEKAATILQLLSGAATVRVESRDITGSMSDDDLEAVTTSIDDWLKTRRVNALPE